MRLTSFRLLSSLEDESQQGEANKGRPLPRFGAVLLEEGMIVDLTSSCRLHFYHTENDSHQPKNKPIDAIMTLSHKNISVRGCIEM
jgi:hypothetical protein